MVTKQAVTTRTAGSETVTPDTAVEVRIVMTVTRERGSAFMTATTTAATNPYVLRATRDPKWNTVVAPVASEPSVEIDAAADRAPGGCSGDTAAHRCSMSYVVASSKIIIPDRQLVYSKSLVHVLPHVVVIMHVIVHGAPETFRHGRALG